MKIHIKHIIILVICLVSVPVSGDSIPGLDILTADAYEISFLFHTGGTEAFTVRTDSMPCQGFKSENLDGAAVPGKIYLPGKTVLLALPPIGDITVHWEPVNQQIRTDIRLAVPVSETPTDTLTFTSFDPERNENPESPVTLLGEGIVRGVRVQGVRVSPFLYDDQTRTLTILETIRVTITFPGDQPEPVLVKRGPADTIFQQLVLNPVQARRWRAPREKQIRTSPPKKKFPDSPAYKMSVTHDGLYRLTDLRTLQGSDPRNLQVFNRGEEIPVSVHGEADGVFDPGDYIEFYGEEYRSDTDESGRYTLTNIYWLTVGDDPGLRTPEIDVSQGSEPLAETYLETRRIEENHIYYNREFHWNTIHYQTTWNYNISLDEIGDCDSEWLLRVRLMGASSIVDTDPDHHAIIRLNDTRIYDAYWDSYDIFQAEIPIDRSLLRDGDNEISVFSAGDTGPMEIDSFNVDWFEIEYPRNFVTTDDHFDFSRPCGVSTGQQRYRVSGLDSPGISLYRTDIPGRLINFTVVPAGNSYQVNFSHDVQPATTYLAAISNTLGEPDSIRLDTPSDLRSESNGADYLIITEKSLIPALAPLVAFHTGRGLRVVIVEAEDIYDEFNSGIFNPEAIREFCRYAYNSWTAPAPSYLLLLGDASWDYKNLLASSIKTNIVPSYGKDWYRAKSKSVTPAAFSPKSRNFLYGDPMVDDQFVCVDGDDNFPDMAVGRITAESPEEVEIFVTKTLAYHNRKRDKDWQKRLLFITGGVGDDEQDLFVQQSQSILNNIILPGNAYWHPSEINKETDDYNFGVYEQAIIDSINAGTLIVNFLGHAGTWSWEAMFDFDDISRLNNFSKLPFIASFTCNTCRFANPEIASFCEEFVMTPSPETGGVATWGGCNFGGFWTDYYLAYYFYDQVLQQRNRDLGLAVMATKILALAQYASYAIIIEPYTYLGDPALELDIPSAPEVKISGLMSNRISSSAGGLFHYVAWVLDPDGPGHIQSVELTAGDQPTGIFLLDDGAHGDFGAGDGVYGITLDIPPGAIAPSIIPIGIKATDIEGNIGFTVPYLTGQ